jgi:CheY-like chemotaxis protein
VEDEINNFLLIKEMLSYEQFKIMHAWNGAEAVEMVISNPAIDIVLMDIKMPVMDGFEAIKHIKHRNPGIPVIALTAYAMTGEKENALCAGFDNYISKPINQDVLLQILSEYK